MRKMSILFVAGLTGFTGLAGLAVQKPVKNWNFDSDKPGEIASGFKSEVGEWKVIVDESAPSKPHVLAQLGFAGVPVGHMKLDSWRTADSAALEPDGSRWRSLHCIRLSGRGRTCTPTVTRNLRLQIIGSRTVCLANTPGTRRQYNPD